MEKVYMYEGFKKYLNEISSPTHEDFIALCAMYHPGTLEKIPHYIARKQGNEPIEYIHPVVEKYLKETYGVLVYKEQIISLFQEIANFTTKECNELCTKICQLMQSTLIWEYHKKFVNQGVLNGYDEQILERIWYFIERNAIYIGSKAETEANLLRRLER